MSNGLRIPTDSLREVFSTLNRTNANVRLMVLIGSEKRTRWVRVGGRRGNETGSVPLRFSFQIRSSLKELPYTYHSRIESGDLHSRISRQRLCHRLAPHSPNCSSKGVPHSRMERYRRYRFPLSNSLSTSLDRDRIPCRGSPTVPWCFLGVKQKVNHFYYPFQLQKIHEVNYPVCWPKFH